MLPAPSTTAISTPRSCTRLIWRAIAETLLPSIPNSRSPIRASPDSLSRMRSKTGSPAAGAPSAASAGEATVLRPDREAGEALDDDVLAELAGQLGADLLDGLAVEAVRV